MSSRQGLDNSPGYVFMEALAYFASPYQLNPFNYNPLKKLIEESVDFERVRTQDAIKLFLSATNVRTAKVKVFSGKELRPEHVLASTCLPLLMQAVEVDIFFDQLLERIEVERVQLIRRGEMGQRLHEHIAR